ncbi:MAG: glycerol-3-phosphate 1-O-acyltransferase PlsY [Microcystis aeruginosa BS13-02]|jgi:glycerol-3-phosphate acyltransferase PlsY|uniref:Glycerol-3-phosphate acyltransferase n=1 Tax=Microcystis aeruginosa Ma_MB_S_20031200_S102 TaxID=2486254 RepID=A0A552ELB5_MICAE|nr:glycerol-3-phosphate 1-O-acyltransferase PlsY [Microcystis aeruginosa BS13-02]TRU27118.1 MAG: glycerol-3-phosphate 1-O-acyltransferase [Microcystis aeruginosa Ma_MB_S_20031200_S102D]TRU35267.1 MAG: glycerol-3-phosphate 1-O-acyltransferase [Microcystis aeruginosa Ma_MB_S_20031200_S102]
MLIPVLISLTILLLSYLLGSIPTGYLIGKYSKGIDIRDYGSGSTGATNVLRTLGKTAGAIVLLIDMLKGMAAVALVRVLYFIDVNPLPDSWYYWLIIGAGLGSVIGHSKSIFLNFSGGKSVATSLGVLLVMNPLVACGTLASFLVMLALFRIVSLGSIIGALVVNILMVVLGQPLPYILFSLMAGTYVIVRHQGNIKRLLAGKEPKIGQKVQQSSEVS